MRQLEMAVKQTVTRPMPLKRGACGGQPQAWRGDGAGMARGWVTDTSGDIRAVEAMSIRLERAFMLAVSCGESEMK